MLDKVKKGEHPTGQAMRAGEWGKSFLPAGVPERIPLPEGSLLVDYVAGGGGFGDPIDRDPQAVLKDFGRGWVSREIAERIYGVVISRDGNAMDAAATNDADRRSANLASESGAGIGKNQRRFSVGEQRLANPACVSMRRWKSASDGKQRVIRCTRCGHMLCDAKENYKLYALHRARHLNDIMPPLPTGEPYIGEYHEYFCPGCATQLQVDMFSPTLGGEPILWDTRIDADKLKSH